MRFYTHASKLSLILLFTFGVAFCAFAQSTAKKKAASPKAGPPPSSKVVKAAPKTSEDVFYVTATLPQFQNEYAFLASYYADDKKYLADSALVSKDHKAVFKVKKSAPGGMYLVILPGKQVFVDVLVDGSGKDFGVSLDTNNIPASLRFEGSPINVAFYRYQNKMGDIEESFGKLISDSTKKDQIEPFRKQATKEIETLKDSIISQFPNSILHKIFLMSDMPKIPEEVQKASQLEQYQYVKQHFWDGLKFNDKQLLYTPLIKRRLDNYFETMVHPSPDSLYKEASAILDQVDKSDSVLYSFYLNSMLVRFGNSKIMGQDKVFVQLFSKYVLDQKPSWMSQTAYDQMKRGYFMLVGNVIGGYAQNIELLDHTNDKPFTIYDVSGKYTVLIFWDPTCSHCKETVPKVDSMFQAKWRKENISLLGIYVDGGVKEWKELIISKKLEGWKHGYQTQEIVDRYYKEQRPNFMQSYNITATPVIYLLDKDKKILAKNIDIYTVDRIIEYTEKQKNSEKSTPASSSK